MTVDSTSVIDLKEWSNLKSVVKIASKDASLVNKSFAAENLVIARQLSINLLRKAPNARQGNKSMNLKRKRSAMDTKFLESVLQCGHLDSKGI